jgi:hypothetical protein
MNQKIKTLKSISSPSNIKTLVDKNKAHIHKKKLKNKASSSNADTGSTRYAQTSLIKDVPITFKIVLEQLLTSNNIDFSLSPAIKEIITFHDNMIKNHSVVEGTARYNSIRLYAINMLEGRNPDPLDRVAVGKKDR